MKTVAVIGPNADSVPALEGNYNGTSSRYVTFLEGIRTYCRNHGIRVMYSLGCHLFKDRTSNLAMADDRMAEASMYAEQADVTIACVGLDAGLEGEEGDTGNEYFSGDKKDLLIPESQRKLLKVLQKSAKKLVTVIAAGSSLNVSEGNAKIFAWYPGQAGGTALAEILFGEINPGGHLPITFYKDVEDLPPFENYSMKERTYRYFTGEVLYPFGFGLSYTTWKITCAKKEGNMILADVTNTGRINGDAVIQVYVQCDCPDAPVYPRLCGFTRVSISAGEARTVAVRLDKLSDTVVNEKGERVTAEKVSFFVGMSQPDEKSVSMSGVKPVKI